RIGGTLENDAQWADMPPIFGSNEQVAPVGYTKPERASIASRQAVYEEPLTMRTRIKPPRDIAEQLCAEQCNPRESTGVVRENTKLGAPPVAYGGYCPVELMRNGVWIQGDPRWTVVYKGLIFRLSGTGQREEFLASPEKFIPASNGFDPVLLVIQGRKVSGNVNFCAAYKSRIYMFSSAENQEEFSKNPERYAGQATK
ncbi:MAG: hypothetical protein ACWGMZ_02920, partial [Thermoguttaceae bacterium]